MLGVFAKSLDLDRTYLETLPYIHGGDSVDCYFNDSAGCIHRIAWYVAYLDGDSPLPPPFVPAFYCSENDERVDDRSIPALLDDFVSPYLDGARIVPFAALFDGDELPLTLRLYTLDSFPADSLCFDRSTSPHSIVVCNGHDGSMAAVRWDDGESEDLEYESFLTPVADSFTAFSALLRGTP